VRFLSSPLRKQLESAVLGARRASESASRAALDNLGVFNERRPEHLDEAQVGLRIGLRAKLRQLGGVRELLVSESAYEQWHRLLFARFLAENNLLLHPKYRAPVTLEECNELASELGEPDGWSVAARFAADILPGIFQLDDPCVRLRLAPEGRDALERVLAGLPVEIFLADDALGWVYQYWQKDKKDEVNASERKIGGADLGPVTQLFTENYMVRFLLDNSLGAWWASRHPNSPLVKDFEYLRVDDDGKPAAGSFQGWPERTADVTVMDPCCGSGHFLVEAFSMLWRMRVEEEGLSPVEAQDAVLRDNLFGLELDPRCVQIAMFNLVLQAWRTGAGWRQLPIPNIACSGIPVKAPLEEWLSLARGDERLENALARLHALFRDADTLGSLIEPRRVAEFAGAAGLQRTFDDIDWEEIAPLIAKATKAEVSDPATQVLGAGLAAVARAADLLSRDYSMVATNVPYLLRRKQLATLRAFCDLYYPRAKNDLATCFLERCCRFVAASGCYALVTPQNWLFLGSYENLRKALLVEQRFCLVARLGEGGFDSPAAAGAFVQLFILGNARPGSNHTFGAVDVSLARSPVAKAKALGLEPMTQVTQESQLANPDARITFQVTASGPKLGRFAESLTGVQTGDAPRFLRYFWELASVSDEWVNHTSSLVETVAFGGREQILLWRNGQALAGQPGAFVRGTKAWKSRGVVVSLMRDMPVTLFGGGAFDQNCAVIVPINGDDLGAIWEFCRSPDFAAAVRRLDPIVKVTNATLGKVPFDAERWRQVAEKAGRLPEPWSEDPTQWLFKGRPEESSSPLQVAVARLLGYRWPEQASKPDDLDTLADLDGIVCLPPVAGDPPAVDRLQRLLGTAFGAAWFPSKLTTLLEQAGSKKKSLGEWLRDEFFKHHCALFANRPFIWHIWDGQRDGFSALVNYHRLDSKMLEKLTYTYLGQDWVERQRSAVRDNIAGAEGRLAAALELQGKLDGILTGEKPYDIYTRWKELHEQPIGWKPDLNDGVRINIRPFAEAGVLRSPVNIDWKKDRGKNPDASERRNDPHYSLADKQRARKAANRS
jgi:N-6 DNA Methylase